MSAVTVGRIGQGPVSAGVGLVRPGRVVAGAKRCVGQVVPCNAVRSRTAAC